MERTRDMLITMEPELADRAQTLFENMGLSFSAAITLFVYQALIQQKIPFEIVADMDSFYSAENMAVLEKSLQELRSGKTVTKTLDELRAME